MNLTPEQEREMLELAAKAAGYSVAFAPHMSMQCEDGIYYTHDRDYPHEGRFGSCWWNPLHDDGDEARLESVLDLDVLWLDNSVVVRMTKENYSDHAGDKQAARRLAGTRAAAEIGRTL